MQDRWPPSKGTAAAAAAAAAAASGSIFHSFKGFSGMPAGEGHSSPGAISFKCSNPFLYTDLYKYIDAHVVFNDDLDLNKSGLEGDPSTGTERSGSDRISVLNTIGSS